MTLATVLTRAQFGVDAPLVRVEVYCGEGLPQLSVVGLAETAVRESKDRVRAALANAGFRFPPGRITVSLAPADLPKEGGRFDLAVALGIIVASGQVPDGTLDGCEFYGELSLSGELRPCRGLLPASLQAARAGHRVVVPAGNLREACVVPDARVAGAGSLLEVCGHLWGSAPLEFITGTALPAPPATGADLRDVRGQAAAKRALEVAAAGGHSLLLIGPPGSGKSMLAARLPGLLPPLNDAEAIEAAVLRSLGRDARPLEQWRLRPFRAPHHGASAVALIGGGAHPRPGEISLAHHGVLFLDELPEFNRDVLEALREPLETGCVSIARSVHRATFPARFQLVAAMNPCPCGYAGDQQGRCRCTAPQIARYVGRLSGPLVDRIDLHVEVAAVDAASLRRAPVAEDGTCEVAARVLAARERQLARAGVLNSALPPSGTEGLADEPAERLLAEAMRRLGMSARGAHRVLRVARTIADLACVDRVGAEHVAEAIGWRRLDRAAATC